MHFVILLLAWGLGHPAALAGDKGMSPAEQRQLQQAVKDLQAQIQQLQKQLDDKSRKPSSGSPGLRTEDYKGQPADTRQGSNEPQLTPEQRAAIMKQLEELKKMQEENHKLLKAIEQEL